MNRIDIDGSVRRVLYLRPPTISRTLAYGASPLIVMVAACAQHEVLPPPSIAPFLFFYLAVTIAAWLGGLGPGLIAVVLSAVVGNVFFTEPLGQFTLSGQIGPATLLFLPIAGTVVVLCGSLRVALAEAASALATQRRVTQELRESEGRFRVLADGSPVILWVTDGAGGIEFVNRTYCEFFGATLEQVAGGKWQPLLHPEDAPTYVEAFLHSVRERTQFRAEARVRRADGEWRWVASFGEPRIASDGQFLGHVGISPDITERKRAEEALRESERHVHAVISAAPVILWEVDETGRIRFSEGRALASLGLRPGQRVGLSVFEIYQDNQEALACIRRGLAGEEFVTEVCVGGSHWRNHYSPLRDAKGAVRGLVATSVDVSERIRVEEEKAKLQEQLLHAQKMESVGRLAGGVAHDFNNMLGVILGHVELALEDTVSNQVRSSLIEVQKAAQRSAELTGQLLAFARKQLISPRVLDLNLTVTALSTMLRRLIGENIQLEWKPAPDLWSIKADSVQLDQILANLCVNARDAIVNTGKIVIDVENCVFDKGTCAAQAGCHPGEYVQLAVRDDGCGMSQETQAHIFEPFFTTKVFGKGTGLGLATVYGIVEQNGGFITVSSEPGTGTTFKIYWPRHIDETKPAAVAGSAARLGLNGDETILFVEDEVALLDLGKIILKRLGYTVLAASTPEEAMRMAGQHRTRIHLLVTDVIMPEMTGVDLAKRLLPTLPGLKCIFVSGYTANVIAHHGVLDGNVNFIPKPFSGQALAAKVRAVLDEKCDAAS
jgi:PAS domain S-box-containing protein